MLLAVQPESVKMQLSANGFAATLLPNVCLKLQMPNQPEQAGGLKHSGH